MSDPTPPAGSAPDPDERDTAEQEPRPDVAAASSAPPPGAVPTDPPPGDAPPAAPTGAVPPAPMSPRLAAAARSRPAFFVAIGLLILVIGIGIGSVGTIGVGLVTGHFHHHGPAAVPFRKDRAPRIAPPDRHLRPGVPLLPGRPAPSITPTPGKTG